MSKQDDLHQEDLAVHDIENGGDGWLVAWVQCMFCGHEAASVRPVVMDGFGECPKCGKFGCSVVYYVDSDGKQIEGEELAALVDYILRAQGFDKDNA